ncbi:hypothetical protein TUM12136_32560 [Klebsiella pneumoniae]|nr:hypothetical protein TUM12136_32560 [Klebsiella pneumoniae]
MCLREKIGPDPRNFNQRVSLGRNDLLIRTFPNAGNLPDNTFSETNKQGFDIHLDGTQSNVINDEYPVSIEIEAID